MTSRTRQLHEPIRPAGLFDHEATLPQLAESPGPLGDRGDFGQFVTGHPFPDAADEQAGDPFARRAAPWLRTERTATNTSQLDYQVLEVIRLSPAVLDRLCERSQRPGNTPETLCLRRSRSHSPGLPAGSRSTALRPRLSSSRRRSS